MYNENITKKIKFKKQAKNKQPAKIPLKPLKTSEFRLFPATLATLPSFKANCVRPPRCRQYVTIYASVT